MCFKPILENHVFQTVLEPFSQPHGKKSNMAGWGPKLKDQPKMVFVPVIYHIGPYENACKSEKVEKVPPYL